MHINIAKSCQYMVTYFSKRITGNPNTFNRLKAEITKKFPEVRLSLWQFFQRFPDEAAAVAYVERKRWPDGTHCRTGSNPVIAEIRQKIADAEELVTHTG